LPKGKRQKIIDNRSLPKTWARKFIEDRIPSTGEGKKQIQLDGEVVDQFRALVDSIAANILDESIRISLRSRSRLTAETLNKVTKTWLGEVGPE
jgi:hypothetical protein